MIKAVIFDFDGTIIDTESAWFDIYRTVLMRDHHFELPLNEFVKIVGTTDGDLFDFIDQSVTHPLDRNLFKEKVKAEFLKIKNDLLPRAGFLDILQCLHNSDIQLALASSSTRDWVVGFLDQHSLTEYFPIIFTAEDVDEVKPNPALYIKTLDALGVEPDEAIAVEDSANGSLAAIRAGINCLIIPNDITKSLSFHKKSKLIESYADFNLVQYLKKATWKQI
ncbi:HAD family hydrolase [Bacillus sp. FSL K6-3431]|uniref:HAD family hydrolase n=1 Tax=Bacillus sp. FSL K6-3431 TaxID=2921500 RepID=UPI0030FBCDFB